MLSKFVMGHMVTCNDRMSHICWSVKQEWSPKFETTNLLSSMEIFKRAAQNPEAYPPSLRFPPPNLSPLVFAIFSFASSLNVIFQTHHSNRLTQNYH